jgi:hypothetical protein
MNKPTVTVRESRIMHHRTSKRIKNVRSKSTKKNRKRNIVVRETVTLRETCDVDREIWR